MRTDVPPPGKPMTFPEWSAAIVAGVRAFLPDVRAARKGARVVIIRHGDREARLEAGGSFWITFPAGEMKTTMASLVDDRRDSFTVSNLAHSILMRARDSMFLSRQNAFSYKGSTFQVEQRKCAVPDGSFRRRKNKKIRLLIEFDKVHRRAPEASADRRLFDGRFSCAESHLRARVRDKSASHARKSWATEILAMN
jgi:hypothetical protein